MTAQDKFAALCETVGHEAVTNELAHWLTSDQLNAFVDDYIRLYDVDIYLEA